MSILTVSILPLNDVPTPPVVVVYVYLIVHFL